MFIFLLYLKQWFYKASATKWGLYAMSFHSFVHLLVRLSPMRTNGGRAYCTSHAGHSDLFILGCKFNALTNALTRYRISCD